MDDQVTITLTREQAGDLLSAVGHYKQYTMSGERVARRSQAGDIAAQMAKIGRSMDEVAAQLLAFDPDGFRA